MMSSAVRPRFCSLMGSARVLGIAAAAAVLVAAAPAFSQNVDLKSLLDRIQQLERDVRTLNIEVARGGSGAATESGAAGTTSAASEDFGPGLRQIVANMEVRLTKLEDETRAATGQAEEVNHQFDLINKRLDKLVSDIDFRLSTLEKGQAELRAHVLGGAAPGQAAAQGAAAGAVASATPAPAGPATAEGRATQPGVLGTLSRQDLAKFSPGGAAGSPAKPAAGTAAQPAATPAGGLPEGTPEQQYAYAFSLLRQTRYDEAEAALRAFLKIHADDPLASNARYWLGETFYVRGQYLKAADTFLQGYQKDPKGAKAPDSLLKLGMSLANLNKKREACATFARLSKEFPDAPSNIQQVAARERQKNACK